MKRMVGIVLAALCVGAGVRVSAEQPRDVGAECAVASLNALKELADTCGIPATELSAAQIEESFPFIGQGKMSADAPVGIEFLFGKDMPGKQKAMFVLPILQGGAALANIPNTTPTERADTVVSGNKTPFRRTEDYLLFGGTVDAISSFDVKGFAGQFKGGADHGRASTSLIRVDADVKKIRVADPEQFKAFLEASAADAQKGLSPYEQVWARLPAKYVSEKVDRMRGEVEKVGENYAVSVSIAPLQGPSEPVARPALPAGCGFRLDLRLKAEFYQSIFKMTPGGELPDHVAAGKLAGDLLFGDTETFAGGLQDDVPVIYDVVHRENLADFAAVLKADIEDTTQKLALQTDPTKRDKLELSEYPSGGLTIQRIKATPIGIPVLYLDAVVKDGVLYTTVSTSDGHFVEKLASLPAEGKSTSVAAGWMKPATLVKFARAFGGNGAELDALAAVGDSKISLNAENETDAVRFQFSFERKMAGGIVKLLMQMQ